MKASRSLAAFAPHRYCRLSSSRQSWVLSGASIPQSRIRVPCISRVSPWTTLACPNKSLDRAGPHEAARTSATSSPFALAGSAIDVPQTQCCTALIAVRKDFCGAVLKNISESVLSSYGYEVSEPTQEKLLNYIRLLASTGKTDDQFMAVRLGLSKRDFGPRSPIFGVLADTAIKAPRQPTPGPSFCESEKLVDAHWRELGRTYREMT
jgi:hypothetical protein